MGLSTKQVSSDALDWCQTLLQDQSFELKEPSFELKDQSFEVKEQQQGPQEEQLKCPRCESTNTKFCYYNNYNQTQPRHFCKACKRHWTKGGTLRNVPVGGHSRKNKRRTKKPHSGSSSASNTTANGVASNVATAVIKDTNLASFDQTSSFRSLNDDRLTILPQMGNQTFSSSLGLSSSTTTMPFNFLQASRAQVPSFPFSSSSATSNVYNYSQDQFKSMEETTITSSMPSTSEWNWEDIETLVSTDLNVTWDD